MSLAIVESIAMGRTIDVVCRVARLVRSHKEERGGEVAGTRALEIV